jgi:hypothetical protein
MKKVVFLLLAVLPLIFSGSDKDDEKEIIMYS